jgi:hypothetical protein
MKMAYVFMIQSKSGFIDSNQFFIFFKDSGNIIGINK